MTRQFLLQRATSDPY